MTDFEEVVAGLEINEPDVPVIGIAFSKDSIKILQSMLCGYRHIALCAVSKTDDEEEANYLHAMAHLEAFETPEQFFILNDTMIAALQSALDVFDEKARPSKEFD